MILRHHQGHILRDAIIPPHLENVFNQLRLGVKRLPGDGARLEGIVLERHKRKIAEPAMLFQIANESSHP